MAAALLGAFSLGGAAEAGAAPPEAASVDVQGHEISTEHIFGFTEGSDTGERGELETEVQSNGAFGKRTGDYAAASNALQLKYSPSANFRIAAVANFSYFRISGVPDLDDRSSFAFEGLGAEIRYRLLDRKTAPFGLTVSAEPSWSRTELGERAERYESEFSVLLDKELVDHRVFAALNLFYEPEWSRPRSSRRWEKESGLGVSAAVTNQVLPGVLVGAEVRYQRAYEGAALNRFAGEALFLGPTLCILPSDRMGLILAWSPQIAGKAVGGPGSLDLTNFERNQVRLLWRLQL